MYYTGAYELGGRAPLPLCVPSLRGALILHLLAFLFLRQSTFFIALHWLHSPKLKELKFILIHKNVLQSSHCLMKYCIKQPCFPFWKQNIFICGFSTKVKFAHFLLHETMKKWRFQRYTSEMLLNKWRVTLKYACIPFMYNIHRIEKIL